MAKLEVAFIADWSEYYTIAVAEKELKDFKFLGEGWYITAKDCMLVVSANTPNYYRFYVWNNPKAREQMQQVINLPVVRG